MSHNLITKHVCVLKTLAANKPLNEPTEVVRDLKRLTYSVVGLYRPTFVKKNILTITLQLADLLNL